MLVSCKLDAVSRPDCDVACSCVSGIAIECALFGADCLSGGGDDMSASIINASGRMLIWMIMLRMKELFVCDGRSFGDCVPCDERCFSGHNPLRTCLKSPGVLLDVAYSLLGAMFWQNEAAKLVTGGCQDSRLAPRSPWSPLLISPG